MALGTSVGLVSSCSKCSGAGFTYGFGGTTLSASRSGDRHGLIGDALCDRRLNLVGVLLLVGEVDRGLGPRDGAVQDAEPEADCCAGAAKEIAVSEK